MANTTTRPWLWLITFIGVIVPRRLRSEWRQEWEAELLYREALLADWDQLSGSTKFYLFRHSLGAFLDALWLQPRRWEDAIIQDLRFGVRLLLKHKSFTAVAVLSLALGIGANTAIFQLVDAVRLRTLPVKDPHELAEIRMGDMKGAMGGFFRAPYPTVTNGIWEQVRNRQQAFAGIFAWGTDNANLAAGGEVRPARLLWVSGEFFNTLGIRPAVGRFLTPTDDRAGCAAAGLVISHEFWQREYGGDLNVVGRKLALGDHSFEVVGVSPAGFFGMEVGKSFDLSLPICAVPLVRGNNRMLTGPVWWLTVTGRLKPGWGIDQATSQLGTISPGIFEAALPAEYPPDRKKDYLASKLIAIPSGSGVSQLRENYQQPLWLLLAIAGLVLLVACANLANLLLARASARGTEIAVRQAVGASRGRLVRQLLVESLLLAALGAALGLALAQALTRFLVAFLSTTDNPVFLSLTPDWRVLGFAAGLTLVTCLLFGVTPAIRATRIELGVAMNAAGRGLTAGRKRFNLRRALVVTQVAVSLVLVACGLLFSRSLGKLTTVDTGFQREGVLTAVVLFQRLNLAPDRITPFTDQLLDQIRAIPGVESVALAHEIPLKSRGGSNVWVDGQNSSHGRATNLSRVSPDYFKTLQIQLLAGRDFDTRDRATAPKVAIVNEAFMREFFKGTNPVGHQLWIEQTVFSPETAYEIVGLVRDTKYGDLREEFMPIVYHAAPQVRGTGPGGQFLIRSRLSSSETVAAVKRVLNDINPAITVRFEWFKPMVDATILRERLMATLSGFFGVLAFLLACIGLYGLLSYGVATRRNEIGIRMALGADRRHVFWLILREGFLLVMVGVLVGLPIIFAVTRLTSSLLFGLTPTDPVSLLLAALAMLAVALVAGCIPSHRATRVDPIVTLRCE